MSRLPGFEAVRPPKPCRRHEEVAEKIARRIVAELNLDDFYWDGPQIKQHIDQMTLAIMAGVPVGARLIIHLQRKHGDWDWEDVADHCAHCGPPIEREVVAEAVARWRERYEVPAASEPSP